LDYIIYLDFYLTKNYIQYPKSLMSNQKSFQMQINALFLFLTRNNLEVLSGIWRMAHVGPEWSHGMAYNGTRHIDVAKWGGS
jgi:hypothetical protein